MRNELFYRAKARMAAIADIMARFQGMAAQIAIQQLGSYRSRGKGRGDGVFRIAGSANMRSKYDPHQGQRECARRIKQGLSSQ